MTRRIGGGKRLGALKSLALFELQLPVHLLAQVDELVGQYINLDGRQFELYLSTLITDTLKLVFDLLAQTLAQLLACPVASVAGLYLGNATGFLLLKLSLLTLSFGLLEEGIFVAGLERIEHGCAVLWNAGFNWYPRAQTAATDNRLFLFDL